MLKCDSIQVWQKKTMLHFFSFPSLVRQTFRANDWQMPFREGRGEGGLKIGGGKKRGDRRRRRGEKKRRKTGLEHLMR